MEIGERIKTCRLAKNMSQQEFAQKIDISYQAVSKWERNKGIPEVSTLIKISEVLDVSIDFLLKGYDGRSDFSHPEEGKKIIDYANSLIQPLCLSEGNKKMLINECQGYFFAEVKEGIDKAYKAYVENKGGATSKTINEMIKKLGGILYTQTLPLLDQKTTYFLRILEKNTYSLNQDTRKTLVDDIKSLYSLCLKERNENESEASVLDNIFYKHIKYANNPYEVHESLQKEIKNRTYYNSRVSKELLDEARPIDVFIIGKRGSRILRRKIRAANRWCQNDKSQIGPQMEELLSCAVFDIAAFYKNKDKVKQLLLVRDLSGILSEFDHFINKHIKGEKNQTVHGFFDRIKAANSDGIIPDEEFINTFNHFLTYLANLHDALKKKIKERENNEKISQNNENL